jgi:hypothetical protein
MRRMIVCPQCGNKRCPKATFHGHACTGSNASGQAGSRFGPPLPALSDAPASEPATASDTFTGKPVLGFPAEFAKVMSEAYAAEMTPERVREICGDPNGCVMVSPDKQEMAEQLMRKQPVCCRGCSKPIIQSNVAGRIADGCPCRFGMYVPPNASTRMEIIAERIERHQSAAVWLPMAEQSVLTFEE